MKVLGQYPLPRGWQWATIPELVGHEGVFIDGDWVESKDQDPNGDVRLIQLADVGDGTYRNRSARFLTRKKAVELGCTFLKSGDVLIARMPDPLGRACIFPGDEMPAVTVVDVCVVRSMNGTFDQRWLSCFVNASPFRDAISSLQAGSTRKRISRGNLATIPLPVPPVDEQHRIVAEIEKQFTRLDAGIAALRRTQANLKRYRASVIEDALAVDWPKMQVSEIGEIVTGTTPSPTVDDNYGGYLPFVTPADLNAGYYLKSATRHLSAKGAELARPLPQGSVLVTCIGATIGKTGLARFPCASNQQINAFIPHDMAVSSEWAFWMFSSPSGQRQILGNASATTLPILNKTRFGMLRIPVPPLETQTQLVAEIERRLTITDSIQETVSRSLTRADGLRRALLETAFTGKLLTT